MSDTRRDRRKSGWGGARPGAGAKPKPPEEVRGNRVAVMLTDAELGRLERIAGARPLASAAYELLSAAIKRRRVV